MLKNILTFYRNPYAGFNTGKNETIEERLTLFKRRLFFAFVPVLSLFYL